MGLALLTVGVLALGVSLLLVEAWKYSPRDILTGGLRNPSLSVVSGRGYLNVGFTALGFAGPCLCFGLALKARQRPELGPLVAPSIFGAAVAAAVTFGGVLGSRQLLMAAILELLVVYHFAYKRIRPIVVGGVAVALGVLGVEFIALRNTGSLSFDPVHAAGLASKTFDGFNFLVATLARIEFDQFAWGRTLVEDVWVTYVPRGLFPDKPLVYGIVAAQDAVIPGLSRTVASGTYPPGILAEGYLNFGVAGIFLLPAVLGAGLRTLYDRAFQQRSPYAVLLLGWAIGNAVGPLRGLGSVFPAFLISAMLLSPLLLPISLVRFPRRSLIRGGVAALVLVAAVPVLLHSGFQQGTARGAEASDAVGRQNLERAMAVAVGRITKVEPIGRTPVVGELALDVEDLVFPGTRRGVGLLLVWSSWCQECEEQLTELVALQRSKGVSVKSIAYQDDPAAAQRALTRAGARWNNLVDDGGHVALTGTDTLPTTFVVDGQVSCQSRGVLGRLELVALLERQLLTGECG